MVIVFIGTSQCIWISENYMHNIRFKDKRDSFRKLKISMNDVNRFKEAHSVLIYQYKTWIQRKSLFVVTRLCSLGPFCFQLQSDIPYKASLLHVSVFSYNTIILERAMFVTIKFRSHTQNHLKLKALKEKSLWLFCK